MGRVADEQKGQTVEPLEALVQAPREINHNGQVYQLAPLRIKDLVALRHRAKELIFSEAQDTLELLPQLPELKDRRSTIWDAAIQDAADPLSSAVSNTPGMLIEYLYLGLRINHPEVTRQKAEEIAGSLGLGELAKVIGDVTSDDTEGEASPPAVAAG